MATIAVGDVHGNLAPVDDLLGQLRTVTSEGDVVVFLGDYIDRGPESKACVEAILALKREVAAKVVACVGTRGFASANTARLSSSLLGFRHGGPRYDPQLLLEAGTDVARRGLEGRDRTIPGPLCAAPTEAFFDCVPKSHVEFFESLRTSYQGPDCVCTHGGLRSRRR